APRHHRIVPVLERQIAVVGIVEGRHKAPPRRARRRPRAPRRGAAAGMDDVDLETADDADQRVGVAPHDQRIFRVQRQRQMAQPDAPAPGHPGAACPASLARKAILARPDGATIAYHRLAGSTPGIVFLGGFRSDMSGTKALFLEDYCQSRGTACVRFDYFGHGASSGDFAHGTIGRWRDDALAIIDSLTEGPQILVGSSMGGWVMLLA